MLTFIRSFEVISANDESNDNNYDLVSNQSPNWWQKKLDRRPILVVNNEPVGTGGLYS